MSRINKLLASIVIGAVMAATGATNAQNLLTNGDFEAAAGLLGWSLEETVTGMPGALVNSAQQQGFANQPATAEGEFGLWLQAFNGNTGAFQDQNKMINAVLSQTVAAAAGESYTWTGWSRFEQNYSGGVDNLDPASPSMGAASPTETTMTLEFLDSGGSVVGSPVMLDVRADRETQVGFPFANDNTWYQHTLMGTAPTGASQVRVTAAAHDMMFNVNPSQSAFYDNFSLTAASAPGAELLANANLNELPPEFEGWTVTELPEGTNTVAPGSFANNPGTGGSNGMWLRGFANGDGIVTQTVAGVVGGNYTFSAWSAWEQYFSGGTAATTTETFLELAFLDADEEEIGEPLKLDLLDAGQTNAPGPISQNPSSWRQFSLPGTAPEGTAFVRVSAGANGMFNTMPPNNGPQSGFFDDLSLTLASSALVGDYNNDNVVDAADYTVWRDNLGDDGSTLGPNRDPSNSGVVSQDDYNSWKANFGATPGAGSVNLLGVAAVPEPVSGMLAALAMAFVAAMRCRRLSVNSN